MAASSLGAPVWRGERGRTEVWYGTFTGADGTGVWVHAETVAPSDGAAPYGHGWIAVFPVGGAAVAERFGPAPVEPTTGDTWFRLGEVELGEGRLRGSTATMAWDLQVVDDSAPLFTFPRRVWERHLLPGAQIVPWPAARVTGTLATSGEPRSFEGTGAVARIFGHGSAQRWGWLHATLPDGGALEIVTATARRRGLRRLRPLAMVQLRLPGRRDWPANPLTASLRFRTTLRADGFSVVGNVGGQRLDVDVTLPGDARVALEYTDPDGATATCTNSERAVARITLQGRHGEQTWHLDGTAHAEVGTRPRGLPSA